MKYIKEFSKKVCIYKMESGVRIPLTKIDIDINCTKVLDFNIEE